MLLGVDMGTYIGNHCSIASMNEIEIIPLCNAKLYLAFMCAVYALFFAFILRLFFVSLLFTFFGSNQHFENIYCLDDLAVFAF
jgi:hypothetical protein